MLLSREEVRNSMSAKTAQFVDMSQRTNANGRIEAPTQTPAGQTPPDAPDSRPGSADQGAMSRSGAGAPEPGSYEYAVAAAEAKGDMATALRLKSQRVFDLSDTAGV